MIFPPIVGKIQFVMLFISIENSYVTLETIKPIIINFNDDSDSETELNIE